MTNETIMEIALAQSATDCGCRPEEILCLGKVPFYCTAWCNLRSARNAFRCGFRPAWAEITVRDMDYVAEFNRGLKL